MSRVFASLVLCCVLSFGQPFRYAAPPMARTVVPVSPTPLVPYKSDNPYYNTPYYNDPYHISPFFNQKGPAVPILSYSSEHAGDGTYAFSFTTADGKQAQENGFLKDAYIDKAGDPQGTQVVHGSFAYVSPEGTPIQVNYVADENGFRPSGVHIPANGKAPALPLPAVGDITKDKQILDPAYNRYSPYNYRNRYNNYGQYRRPYDPRYPHDSTRFNPYYNNYNPFLAAQNKNVKGDAERNPHKNLSLY